MGGERKIPAGSDNARSTRSEVQALWLLAKRVRRVPFVHMPAVNIHRALEQARASKLPLPPDTQAHIG